MPTSLRRPLTGLVALAAVATASACTSTEDTGGSGGGSIEVAASDDSCDVSDTDLDAGLHTFEVTNDGSQVTEFYVYAEGDRIMQEVENIGPGLTRELRVDLQAGHDRRRHPDLDLGHRRGRSDAVGPGGAEGGREELPELCPDPVAVAGEPVAAVRRRG